MKRTIFCLIFSLCALFAYASVGIDANDTKRAEEIVARMSLEQKCRLITGQIDGFHTAEFAEFGIPSVRMADGPQGVRNNTNSTYYPSGISIAACFNRERAKGVGEGIGLDASARGVRIMLCPGVNIYRSPLCGRNFEYYGEDPYLASETAGNYIEGIQSKRVIATIKHFALNNQEYDRHWTGSYADERTINEIYFPTFRKAVEKAGVGAVMTSYNPVNGVHAAENAWLIGQLRSWGHKGIVMSDWTSTYTTYGCLTGGLDLEMPHKYALGYEDVKPLVENGVVSEKLVDEKCVHILQTFIAFGLLDRPAKDESIPEDYEVSRNYAYQAALEGPVLLKNEGILPIRRSSRNNIVLVGPNADYVAFGGGSGRMDPFPERNITILQGLKKLGKGYRTTFAGAAIDESNEALIRKASVVIVAAGFNSKSEKEGADRTYSLPEGQDEMILRACELNPNVVVLINSGGEVCVTPWLDKVKALMMTWYSGQEGGNAIAALLSGAVSPSGRLPFTFWGSLEDNVTSGSYAKEHPNCIQPKKHTNRDPHPSVTYREGVFLGYRGVEKFGRTPLFPFGYGLTYSSFEYYDLSLEKCDSGVKVSFTVKNVGPDCAAEAAQVYVAPLEPKVARPAKELKGYEKKSLKKGECAKYELILDEDAFKYYDAASHSWVKDNPKFEIQVGASSSDIRLKGNIEF